jgi:hypothetical protein
LRCCDGEWEHRHGVTIETLDNPGWSIRIDLQDTPLRDRSFDKIDAHRTEEDWLVCWVEQEQFHGACGPRNLTETIDAFVRWAERGNGPSGSDAQASTADG